MADIVLNSSYPMVFFSDEEHLYAKTIADIITQKKRCKGDPFERMIAEVGEQAVDILLEKFDKDRCWSRGRFHFDFSNKSGDLRLEVKTRKKYLPRIEDLDVRLDFWDYDNASEATHLVPVIYDEMDKGARVITPGVVKLEEFLSGIREHKTEIPVDRRLKHGCFRAPWNIVFKYADDFGYQPWEEFLKTF